MSGNAKIAAQARRMAQAILDVARSFLPSSPEAALEAMRHALEEEATGRLVAQAQVRGLEERVRELEAHLARVCDGRLVENLRASVGRAS